MRCRCELYPAWEASLKAISVVPLLWIVWCFSQLARNTKFTACQRIITNIMLASRSMLSLSAIVGNTCQLKPLYLPNLSPKNLPAPQQLCHQPPLVATAQLSAHLSLSASQLLNCIPLEEAVAGRYDGEFSESPASPTPVYDVRRV
jgi:hypothetical protein